MGKEFVVSTDYPGYVFLGWAKGQFEPEVVLGYHGCRAFESMSKLAPVREQDGASQVFPELFRQLASDETANISRIDMACDDREGFLNMEEIIVKVQANELNSRRIFRYILVLVPQQKFC